MTRQRFGDGINAGSLAPLGDEGFANCLAAVLGNDLSVNESFDPHGIRAVTPHSVEGSGWGIEVRMDDGSVVDILVRRRVE